MNRKGFLWKRAVAVALFALIWIPLSGCNPANTNDEGQARQASGDTYMQQELEVKVMEDEDSRVVFDIYAEDFIDAFNSVRGEAYLPQVHEWPLYNTMAVHADNEAICRYYSEDESIRAIPKVSVFTPTTDDRLQQIMITYDDHSYSIPTYEMYEKLCFYAVKTMLPELEDDEARKLCEEINEAADENITDVHYSSEAVPCGLYHKNGVGIYPYYCIGEELRFCIIPVTENILEDFEERGTEIIALQN